MYIKHRKPAKAIISRFYIHHIPEILFSIPIIVPYIQICRILYVYVRIVLWLSVCVCYFHCFWFFFYSVHMWGVRRMKKRVFLFQFIYKIVKKKMCNVLFATNGIKQQKERSHTHTHTRYTHTNTLTSPIMPLL